MNWGGQHKMDTMTKMQWPHVGKTPSHILFGFYGRITRQQYWAYGFFGLLGLSLLGSALLDIAQFKPVDVDEFMKLALVWPLFAVVIKRCHDRNKSAWWSLLVLVPIVNVYFLCIELGLRGAHPQAHQFGPAPMRPRW